MSVRGYGSCTDLEHLISRYIEGAIEEPAMEYNESQPTYGDGSRWKFRQVLRAKRSEDFDHALEKRGQCLRCHLRTLVTPFGALEKSGCTWRPEYDSEKAVLPALATSTPLGKPQSLPAVSAAPCNFIVAMNATKCCA
jgi:hypothetical protein